MNISPKKFLCQCAHSLWNLIVSIGRKYMADPVYAKYQLDILKYTIAIKEKHNQQNLVFRPVILLFIHLAIRKYPLSCKDI